MENQLCRDILATLKAVDGYDPSAEAENALLGLLTSWKEALVDAVAEEIEAEEEVFLEEEVDLSLEEEPSFDDDDEYDDGGEEEEALWEDEEDEEEDRP